MRILANENIPADAVQLLRSHGHDVFWVRTESPGAADHANLARALSEQRLLITFDKDFGELVFRLGRDASCGIVLFRIAAASSAAAAAKIADTLESRTDWGGNFSVVDDFRVRMMPLPGPAQQRPR